MPALCGSGPPHAICAGRSEHDSERQSYRQPENPTAGENGDESARNDSKNYACQRNSLHNLLHARERDFSYFPAPLALLAGSSSEPFTTGFGVLSPISRTFESSSESCIPLSDSNSAGT